jgi:hypothetical protein
MKASMSGDHQPYRRGQYVTQVICITDPSFLIQPRAQRVALTTTASGNVRSDGLSVRSLNFIMCYSNDLL